MKVFVAVSLIVLLAEVYSSPVSSANDKIKLNPEEIANQFEGDIVIPDVVADPLTRSGRNGITDKSMMWPKNGYNQVVVPYTIQGPYSSSDLSLIQSGLDAIQQSTCIRFTARKSETDYVEIVSKSGCSSYVGRIGGRQQVSLAGSSSAAHCMVKGIVIHEVLHALGFYHMHSSPDRDNYVKINYSNIIWGLSYAFSKVASSNLYGTKYDVESVMHYSPYFFTNNGKPTIEPLNKAYLTNNLMGQRVGLSSGDITRINKMYGC